MDFESSGRVVRPCVEAWQPQEPSAECQQEPVVTGGTPRLVGNPDTDVFYRQCDDCPEDGRRRQGVPGVVLCESCFVQRISRRAVQAASEQPVEISDGESKLSDLEERVLHGRRSGRSYRQLAESLGIGYGTVQRAMRRLRDHGVCDV